MKAHTFLFIFLSTLISFFGVSQHQEVTEKPSMWKGKTKTTEDSTSILHAFKAGTYHGHFRYYFSHTNNERQLSDYYANAIGGGLRFETAKFYKFQFGVSGFYFFNIGSSDFSKKDSISGQFNRYETALFDVENPNNHKDMDRLEELYLKYNFRKSDLVFGRQLINTPLMNLQDGRMRASGVEGLWFHINEWNKLKLEGGFLYAMSPRGTTRWYTGGESIGVYPGGVDHNGQKSKYSGNVESLGVGVLGLHYTPHKNLKIHAWDYLIENVMNTSFLQIDYEKKLAKNNILVGGLQGIYQFQVGDGGNSDQSLAYIQKDAKASTIGAKLGWKKDKWGVSLNYNHITKQGRFLAPREWGRDPFFTFLPRERNEGAGNVHAFVGKIDRNFPKAAIKASLGFGYVQMPDVHQFELNKYGLPSYSQINLDLKHPFTGKLTGLDVHFLTVVKINQAGSLNHDKYVINKVNMGLVNLILNYHF